MGIEKFEELARLVSEARAEYEDFSRGRKVAGTRARKALQEIKRAAQEARIDIQQTKKTAAAGGAAPAAGGTPPPQ